MNPDQELALTGMHRMLPPRMQQIAADGDGVSAAEVPFFGQTASIASRVD